MSELGSVSEWIRGLKGGEANAAQELWERYAEQLTALARMRLGSAPATIADDEDIAQNVFSIICLGASRGKFADVCKRDELWWLLMRLTRDEAARHVRRETALKRGGGRVFGVTAVNRCSEIGAEFSLDVLVGDEPTPEYLISLNEQHNRCLDLLNDDQLRAVANWRIAGYEIKEIADRLSLSQRSIERKLRVIRELWGNEFIQGERQRA